MIAYLQIVLSWGWNCSLNYEISNIYQRVLTQGPLISPILHPNCRRSIHFWGISYMYIQYCDQFKSSTDVLLCNLCLCKHIFVISNIYMYLDSLVLWMCMYQFNCIINYSTIFIENICFFNVCQIVISLLDMYVVVIFYVQFHCTIFVFMLSA